MLHSQNSNILNIKINKIDLVKNSNNRILKCTEIISGGRKIYNYIIIILFWVGGTGFYFLGILSYIKRDLLSVYNFSLIEFIPQGILLIFYGTCLMLFGILISILTNWDIGSGTNTYDYKNQVVRLSRRGLLQFNDFKVKQNIIYLVYSFSEIKNLELDIIGNFNNQKCIYLILKDGRKIPLTSSIKLKDPLFLENRAIFLAKFIGIDLKFNIKN